MAGQNIFKQQSQFGQIIGNHGPENIDVHVKVNMNQTIEHRYCYTPWDMANGNLGRLRNTGGSFANDLNTFHQCKSGF